MSEIKNYNQFCSAVDALETIKRKFFRLNMFLKDDFNIDCDFPEYIKTQIEENDTWHLGLPLNEKLALALAMTEEDRNNHIDDSEIDFVNKFFDLKIDRALVSKMHSKYI